MFLLVKYSIIACFFLASQYSDFFIGKKHCRGEGLLWLCMPRFLAFATEFYECRFCSSHIVRNLWLMVSDLQSMTCCLWGCDEAVYHGESELFLLWWKRCKKEKVIMIPKDLETLVLYEIFCVVFFHTQN